MEKTNNAMDTIDELFLAPFLDQLIESYPSKTKENKDIVSFFVVCAKQYKLNFDVVKMVDDKITPSKRDQTANAIESLWKLFNDKIDLSKIYTNTNKNLIIRECTQIIHSKIESYYGEPNLENQISKIEVNKKINSFIDKAIAYAKLGCTYTPLLCSYRANQLKEYKGEENMYKQVTFNPKHIHFEKCDFSNKNMKEISINNWYVSESKFCGTKFKGNGATNTCLHFKDATNCDFSGAQFEGKICNKTSKYNGSSFEGVNLTPLMFNCGEVYMDNCDFTDAFVIDEDGTKLQGKYLIKYLKETKGLDVKNYRYSSPNDDDYDEDELDEEVWSNSKRNKHN